MEAEMRLRKILSFLILAAIIGLALPAAAAQPRPAPLRRGAPRTKGVTSVAVMILFEEGKLLLGDPVSKYLPEFKTTTVAVPDGSKKGRGYRLVPAPRPTT